MSALREKNKRGLFALERGYQPGALPGLCTGGERQSSENARGNEQKNALGIT